MSRNALRSIVPVAALGLALAFASPASAQVGKGLIDLNSAPEKELAALPNVTPASSRASSRSGPSPPSWTPTPTSSSQSLTADAADRDLSQGIRAREPEHGDARARSC